MSTLVETPYSNPDNSGNYLKMNDSESRLFKKLNGQTINDNSLTEKNFFPVLCYIRRLYDEIDQNKINAIVEKFGTKNFWILLKSKTIEYILEGYFKKHISFGENLPLDWLGEISLLELKPEEIKRFFNCGYPINNSNDENYKKFMIEMYKKLLEAGPISKETKTNLENCLGGTYRSGVGDIIVETYNKLSNAGFISDTIKEELKKLLLTKKTDEIYGNDKIYKISDESDYDKFDINLFYRILENPDSASEDILLYFREQIFDPEKIFDPKYKLPSIEQEKYSKFIGILVEKGLISSVNLSIGNTHLSFRN